MRSASLPALAAALVAASAAAAVAASASPSLHVSTTPLVVRGAQFRPLERVRVTASYGDARVTRLVRSTRAGRFVASFGAAYDPCVETLRVTAAGASGDRAHEKLPQRACPPPP
jgi:hypothetical protein